MLIVASFHLELKVKMLTRQEKSSVNVDDRISNGASRPHHLTYVGEAHEREPKVVAQGLGRYLFPYFMWPRPRPTWIVIMIMKVLGLVSINPNGPCRVHVPRLTLECWGESCGELGGQCN